MVVHNTEGAPAEGEDFYGRESEGKILWRALERQNVLLLGPRRVGKSSMLRFLKRTAKDHGLTAIEISLGHLTSELQFIEIFAKAIGEHPEGKLIAKAIQGGAIGNFLESFKKINVAGIGVERDSKAAADWTNLGEAFADALSKTPDTKWLFLIDEVSNLVQHLVETDPKRARVFLNWLRDLRIGPKAVKQNRWFFTGSIGLPTITHRDSLGDTINDLKSPFDHFGPYKLDVARSFLKELATGENYPLPDEVIEKIVAKVGWLIPYHLQCVFSRMRDADEPATMEGVDRAVDRLLDATVASVFDFWEERIRKHLNTPDSKAAFRILEVVAKDPDGAAEETVTQALSHVVSNADEREKVRAYLVRLLAADGYIVHHKGRYRFLSPLLCEYWRRNILHG